MAAQALNDHGGQPQRQAKAVAHHSYNYKNLTVSDLNCLAEVLLASPAETSAVTSSDAATKAMIARLPQNLRCKHSWLSTFCSKHTKLNPLPIISLWRAIRNIILDELEKTLLPLRKAGKTSTEQTCYIDALRAHDWQEAGCEACSIVTMAKKKVLVLAIAAVHLAVLPPRHWRKSKRIYFLNQLLHGRNSSGTGDTAMVKIYALGSPLHMLRYHLHGKAHEAIDLLHSDPQHKVDAESIHADDNGDGSAVSGQTYSSVPPTDSQHLRNPPWPATAFSVNDNGNMASTVPFERSPSNEQGDGAALRIPDTTDDLFADPVSSEVSLETGSIMIGNDVRDFFDDEPAPTPTNPMWKFRPVSRASQRLDNVWLPRTKCGDQEMLLKRERSLRPVLRMGRNGEVKGPFDPRSRSALEGIYEEYG